MPLAAFHEVSFPARVALGASGGPVRRTEVLQLASGRESRNQRWRVSRRRYDAGVGVRTLDDLYEIVAFFEARAGRMYGFRFRDPLDHRSCAPGSEVTPFDQVLGRGDGATTGFPLVKAVPGAPWSRAIVKPVAGTVRLAVDGEERAAGSFSVDAATGMVSLAPGAIPADGQRVTAGFEFDVPVRFDTDEIRVNLVALRAGEIPDIPLLEVLA